MEVGVGYAREKPPKLCWLADFHKALVNIAYVWNDFQSLAYQPSLESFHEATRNIPADLHKSQIQLKRIGTN